MKWIAILSVVVSTGCGASALQVHAQAAEAVRILNNDAVELAEEACEQKSSLAARNPDVSTDQAEEDANGVLEVCVEIKDAQHLVAEAHMVWVMALLNAMSEDGIDLQSLAFLAIAVVRLYVEVIPIAARLDITLPEVPLIVQQVTGGGE